MPNGKAIVYNGQVIGTPSGAVAIDNLVAENIKSGVNVGGVVGNYTGSYSPSMHISFIKDRYATKYIDLENVPFEVKSVIFSLKAQPSGSTGSVGNGYVVKNGTSFVSMYGTSYDANATITQNGTNVRIQITQNYYFYAYGQYEIALFGE